MRTYRIWLLAFMLVLLTAPFASVYTIREGNRRFEEAERAYILATGSNEGLYGDCSGVTVIIPVLAAVYCVAFFLWAALLIFIAGTLSSSAVHTQTLLIGILGVFPCLLWLLMVCLR